ncbi:MAG: hypothetical protein IIC82_06090 [Chloroflexi bacterium]|nr:hypothetical protein [Chloroflexota bacterium]
MKLKIPWVRQKPEVGVPSLPDEAAVYEQQLLGQIEELKIDLARAERRAAVAPQAPGQYVWGYIRCGADHLKALQAQLRGTVNPSITIHSDESGWWFVAKDAPEEAKYNALVARVKDYMAVNG